MTSRVYESEIPIFPEYHMEFFKGAKHWNAWRQQNPQLQPNFSGHIFPNASFSGFDLNGADLSKTSFLRSNIKEGTYIGADLTGANLSGANLSEADLTGANLFGVNLSAACLRKANLGDANLFRTDLTGSILVKANLRKVNLIKANLSDADCTEANLIEANLSQTDLTGANLTGANLSRAMLVRTNLAKAILTQCSVYGISAWDVQLVGAKQENIVITDDNEPTITVDNLEVAQFIYLMLNNSRIRNIINTITTKVVLILGRFTPERKAILDALREALRQKDYLPVLFDFEKPNNRNLTETVRTLAHLARFIIADLTDPSSIPQELQAIIPILAVPVQPVLLKGKRAHAMFIDFPKTYDWVLPLHVYKDQSSLLASLKEQIIEPAERKSKDLEKKRM